MRRSRQVPISSRLRCKYFTGRSSPAERQLWTAARRNPRLFIHASSAQICRTSGLRVSRNSPAENLRRWPIYLPGAKTAVADAVHLLSSAWNVNVRFDAVLSSRCCSLSIFFSWPSLSTARMSATSPYTAMAEQGIKVPIFITSFHCASALLSLRFPASWVRLRQQCGL